MTEICEWASEDSSELSELYHTDCGHYKQERMKRYFNFTFCPFCGKRIKLA